MKVDLIYPITIGLLLLFINPEEILAQNKKRLEYMNSDQLELYRHKAVRLRNAGIILTSAGTGLMIAGKIMASLPTTHDPAMDGDHAHDGISIIAIALTEMAGITLNLTGIPLWITGGVRKSKVDVAIKKLDMPMRNEMALGVGIKISF